MRIHLAASAAYHEGQQSSDCQHDQSMYVHTNSDGSTRTVVYCRRCGMEW